MRFYPEKLDTSEDTTGGREFRRSGGEAMDINVVDEKVHEEVGCEPVTIQV